jgi:CheY-like chemotaxis protein
MRPHVVVVDDHADTLLLFVEELREANYEVTGTTSPDDALSLAIKIKPSVIVMDIAMPRMDGYELARLVRSYAATRGIRLVAVSAYDFDLSPIQLPPGGWDAYLKKPLEPGTLAAVVRTVLSAAIVSVHKTGPVPIPTPTPATPRSGKNGGRKD